jgi:hypothetical protein
MSHRRIHLGLLVLIVAAVPVVGCGGNGSTPASPAGVPAGLLGNNPDGSTLKVTAPALQSPTNFLELDDLTPTFRFTAAQGLYVPLTLGHEVEVLTEGGQQLRLLPVGPGVTQVTYPGELDMASTYQWRVRATYQGHVGPWSGTAAFVTRSIPQVTPETLDEYLIAFSAGNANWAGCSAGSGVACFRYVYEVVQSMNPTCDPNSWGLLSKNPGEQQCTLERCGSLGGEGFGEDIVTHGGFSPILLWDVVVGAGAPGASLGASPIPRDARRPGNEWACPWR